MDSMISFELKEAELQQLHGLNWRRQSLDSMCQLIVRDYLLRKRLKAERQRRKIERADRAGNARRAGL